MLMMSFFYPPIAEKRYVDCVLCKRFVSVGQTELLFMDKKIDYSLDIELHPPLEVAFSLPRFFFSLSFFSPAN